jgi:hypothetical protein
MKIEDHECGQPKNPYKTLNSMLLLMLLAIPNT